MKNVLPIRVNEVLRLIIASSSDPVLITTREADIVYANPAWEKLTGYSLKDVLEKNPRVLKSDKTPSTVYTKMWWNLLHKKPFTTEKLVNKKKNGTEYQLRSSIYPVLKDDEISYYIQLQQDITKEKKLAELQKEFISATAHELKTPITVLKLLTQAHLNKAKDQKTDVINVSELELIDRELQRLVQLINDMLDSSRLETGKPFIIKQRVDLSTLIKKTVEKMQIYAKNHRIIIKQLPKKIIVVADPSRIEQVLLNLLSNAVKYSPHSKNIFVSLEVKDTNALVIVQDEGIGIPKSKQKIIFDKYYQVKTKSRIGFGLGLYISKEIINLHKGEIGVASKKGSGSSFFFTLPLAT